MDLNINSYLTIPSKELKWRFSRASGPGGQGVNKTDSKVELIFDIEHSSVISSFLKQRMLKKLQSKCTNGCLNIIAKEKRSQYQNRQLALARLQKLLQKGLNSSPKSRKSTKPTLASQNRRITIKKRRSVLKQKRRHTPLADE